MLRLALFALLFAASNAFQAALPVFSAPKTAVSTTARHVIMSDEEITAVLKSAGEVADGECTVEEVTKLITELREQETILEDRLEKIMNMIAHLQHVNEKDERKTDEVRAFVRDMLRVFDTEKGLGFNPAGFSGDILKGSNTAYDLLPPKKWKSSDKK